MKLFWTILLFISCASTKPVIIPPVIVVNPPVPPKPPIIFPTVAPDTNNVINPVVWGAIGNNSFDCYPVLQASINYIITHPGTKVILPPGIYSITHPLKFENFDGVNYNFFTTDFEGALSAKCASQPYLSEIRPTFTDSFAVGFQNARQCTFKNISIIGKYTFPYSVTPQSIQTLKWADWSNHGCADSRYDVYAGISIDYAPGSGTSGMNIVDCAVKNFPVDIIISPTGQSTQAEMINIIDCDIEFAKVGIAICQDQSKECHVIRLKSWGGVNTLIDCTHYGKGIGTMPFIDGINLAGSGFQIFDCPSSGRFTGSATNIYAESWYKIGIIGGDPTPTISNSTFDLALGGPSPDYIVLGQANFDDCQIRYYNGQNNRFILTNFSGTFTNGMIESPPIISGLYNTDYNSGLLEFRNVTMYDVNGTGIGSSKLGRGFASKKLAFSQYANDPVWPTNIYNTSDSGIVQYVDTYDRYSFLATVNVNVDTVAWISTFTLPTVSGLNIGDYLITGGGGPNGYYDKDYLGAMNCYTIMVGRVKSITGNQVICDQPGINLLPGTTSLYKSYYLLNSQYRK